MVRMLRSRKHTAVDDDTADGRSMASDPLRCAVHDDIRAVLDGADKVSCAKLAHPLLRRVPPQLTSHAERVVDDQGDTVIMRDLHHESVRVVGAEGVCLCGYFRELRERSNVVLGVADALDVDGFRLVIYGSSELRGVVAMNELDGDAETLQEYCGKLAKLVQAEIGARFTFELVVRLSRMKVRGTLY